MSTPISLAALIVAVLVAYAAGQTDNAISLKPTRVDADKAFDLEVLSMRWSCGATYSYIQSAQSGTSNRLNVNFLVTEDPVAICPAILKPYGPKVPIKALPAGRYDVHVGLLLPCHVLPQPCEAPMKVERVGFLTVGPEAGADWFASPVTRPSGKPFDLRILSDKYGNCHTSFGHESLEVKDGRLVASFVINTDTTVFCIVDIHPHGPTFRVEALPAGKYPVDVIEIPACVYQNPACPWLPPQMVARTVDTLVVSGTTGIIASGKDGKRSRAHFDRSHLKLTEPSGTRTLDLQGRVLDPVLP